MNKNYHPLLTLFLLLFATATSYGQPAGIKTLSISLDQSVQIAVENSKSLHASLMKVEHADAKASEVASSKLPMLKFGGSYTRLSEVPPYEVSLPFLPAPNNVFVISPSIFDNYNLKLSLQQPIFTGFKIESGTDMANYNAIATDYDYKKDKSELLFNTKSAYWNLFKARQYKALLDENISQMNAHLKDVQNMMAQGLATNNDVLKVQVQLSNVQLMQLDAENMVHLARINLNYLMGQPLETEIELTSTPDSSTVSSASLEPIDHYIAKAHEERAEVKGMEYRVKASESGVTFAKSNWFPQVYLAGNYYYARPNQRVLPTEDKFKDTWDASLVVSFDVWNWGITSDQTHQAQAQLAQAQDGLSQLRDGITMEVTQSYLSLTKSKQSIILANQGVQQAEENYRITNDKFKAGLTSNSELLDAEVAMLQAKTNYTSSLVDLELASARLSKAIGE